MNLLFTRLFIPFLEIYFEYEMYFPLVVNHFPHLKQVLFVHSHRKEDK